MTQTLLAALAEPNRFRIVEFLREGPRPVQDIVDGLRLNQPQVSKHLRALKDAGLVDVSARAQQRLYALQAAPFRDLQQWIERYRQLWDARFSHMDELLRELAQREEQDRDPPKG